MVYYKEYGSGVPGDIQDAMVEELAKIFDGHEIPSPDGKLKKLNIFEQDVPVLTSDPAECTDEELESGLNHDSTNEKLFPYIVVILGDGDVPDVGEKEKVNLSLVAGVYDESKGKSGFKYILHIFQVIRERFEKNPCLADRYILTYPIKWKLQDEDTYPYFFGGLYLTFETSRYSREDNLA